MTFDRLWVNFLEVLGLEFFSLYVCFSDRQYVNKPDKMISGKDFAKRASPTLRKDSTSDVPKMSSRSEALALNTLDYQPGDDPRLGAAR